MEHEQENIGNLSDVLQGLATTSKAGKKLQVMEENIKEAKVILKTLDETETLTETKQKVESIVNLLFVRNHLVTQYKYLNNKRTTQEMIAQAYYAIIAKDEQLEKSQRKLREKFELEEN